VRLHAQAFAFADHTAILNNHPRISIVSLDDDDDDNGREEEE
jgi:hypothetical protein